MINPYMMLGAAVSVVVIAVSAYFFGSSVKNDEWQAKWSDREASLQREYSDSLAQANERERILQSAFMGLDEMGQKELGKNEQTISSLRADVDAGSKRLRVAAACPGASSVPGGSAGPGVDNGTGAELNANARQDYFALTGGIVRTQTKLTACQGILREIQAKMGIGHD